MMFLPQSCHGVHGSQVTKWHVHAFLQVVAVGETSQSANFEMKVICRRIRIQKKTGNGLQLVVLSFKGDSFMKEMITWESTEDRLNPQPFNHQSTIG